MRRKTFGEMVQALARSRRDLRGSEKLRAALEVFDVALTGRIALDVGASTGGFTTVLLENGASKVYAVDVGHGQLLGSLRQDRRVVNLEATNVADLSRQVVPDLVDVVTVDVSYLALSDAVRQLDRVRIAADADLIGLVKPMFELKLGAAPTDRPALDRALGLATAGVANAGWTVLASMDSAFGGAKGAPEMFLHARRSSG